MACRFGFLDILYNVSFCERLKINSNVPLYVDIDEDNSHKVYDVREEMPFNTFAGICFFF